MSNEEYCIDDQYLHMIYDE